jgi:hypothetical protein
MLMANSIPFEFSGAGNLGRGLIVTEKTAFINVIQDYLSGIGVYIFVNGSNQISVGSFDSTFLYSDFESVKTFTDDDIVKFSYEIAWRDMINSALFEYNKDWLAGNYTGKVSASLDDSVTEYNANEVPFSVQNDWAQIAGTVATDYYQDVFLRRWFYAFGNPPGRFKFTDNTENIIYDPGDFCLFTLAREITMDGSAAAEGWTEKKALLTGQEIDFVLQEGNQGDPVADMNVYYDGIIFNVLGKVTGFQTDNTVSEATITSDGRTALDFGSANSATLEAEDAYVDFSPAITAQGFRFQIEIDVPDNSTNNHHLFAIAVHVQNPAGTDVWTTVANGMIRYGPTNSARTVTTEFFVMNDSSLTVSRFKVDAYDLRQVNTPGAVPGETEGDTVTANEVPTLAFTRLIYTTYGAAIS